MPSAIETFEHIIRHQTTAELLPFLLTIEKKDVVAMRAKVISLKKELDVIIETENSWRSKGTSEQFANLFFAGLGVFSRREALGTGLVRTWVRFLSSHPAAELAVQREQFLTMVRHRRPDWLHDWLLSLQRPGGQWGVDYTLLRTLEEEALISYSPTLAVNSLVSILPYAGIALSTRDAVPANALAVIASRFHADERLLTRDLPLIFDLESGVDRLMARVQPVMPSNLEFPKDEADSRHRYPWQWWNELHPPQEINWQDLLLSLVASGHLGRGDLLTRSLLALRRDFRRPLLTWFKEFYLALQPTLTERLARQAELVELLTHPVPLVANFAIEQLKNLLPESGFALAPVLLYTDNLFLRPDIKTGLKTLLASLAKLPKQDAAQAPAVAQLLANALANPDGAVQERAAKGLAELLKAKKPLLSADEMAVVTATIGHAQELLASSARAVLAPWLAAPETTDTPAATTATYAPKQHLVPEISPATAIVPVADWHELLFLTGQVLKHDDPTALEHWLDGLLRLQAQLPTGYAAQLQPFLVQILPSIKKANTAELRELLAGPVRLDGHEGLAPALLLSWATSFAVPRVESVQVQGSYDARTPLLPIDKQRYLHAEKLLREQRALPLLSTPSHAPYWLAPSILVQKLLVYEAAGLEPDLADLAVALARTAHTHPAEATAALRRLPQLRNPELRQLLAWFLGPTDVPLPAPANPPSRKPAQLPVPLAEALPELWAVAARTKAPHADFPTLPGWLGYDYPSVAQPLQPTLALVERENSYEDFSTVGQPTITHRWVELQWGNAATSISPSPLLLYSPPGPKNEAGSWEHNILFANDFLFLNALLPNYPAPLYEYILQCAAWTDNLESTERDLVMAGLRALLGAGPVYSPAALFLLGSGLIHHTSLCRSLAQEVLVQAVAQGRLVPSPLGQVLGRQLAAGFAPMPRLADNLAPLCGIDATTDDALLQLLTALLPELPATPPRNLRKLLEVYADLLVRTRQPVPDVVRTGLLQWQKSASLKPVVSALLKG